MRYHLLAFCQSVIHSFRFGDSYRISELCKLVTVETVERHIFDAQLKYCEPVSNVAKDDVAKEAAHIEERGGNMRPLGIVAH